MLFYDNFERICRERGTSPSGACVAIGKNKTTAGNWKRNGTIPSEDILVDLADVLGCSVADFFDSPNFDRRANDFMSYYHVVMGKPRSELSTAQREIRDAIAHDAEPVRGLDEYQGDFMTIYGELDRRDRLELMSLIYEFADEKGVVL